MAKVLSINLETQFTYPLDRGGLVVLFAFPPMSSRFESVSVELQITQMKEFIQKMGYGIGKVFIVESLITPEGRGVLEEVKDLLTDNVKALPNQQGKDWLLLTPDRPEIGIELYLHLGRYFATGGGDEGARRFGLREFKI